MPKLMQYSKGSIVYFEGDKDERIFILQKGLAVSTTTDIESKEPLTEQIKNGEFFGVKSSLGHFPREETVTVLSDSTCVALTVPEFESMFGSNKGVIMKMLRVFSGQLRQVHKKIESILNQDLTINPMSAMISVAQAFYNDEKFRSCCDVCIAFLKRYPNYYDKNEVVKMYTMSKAQADRHANNYEEEAADEVSSGGTLHQFDLPAFQRFAKNYEPGQVIICEFEPGDTFYLIQHGKVQLVKCVNGTNKNLDILKPGELFGEMAILDNSPRSATCMAAGHVQCLEFSKANFELLVAGNPQIALMLLKLFCKRIYDQKRRLKILVINDLQARIADVFCMLDEMNPVSMTNKTLRRFDVTIQDIARWAGLSMDLTRTEIDKYIARNKIEVYENYMIVHSIGDMERMANNGQISRN
ncbi:MAG: Crp/Fnr family transcriptional regulator [Treponema sp.]|nr:Crp/Fnr family transcriptional regulator [Treponema sp.]